MIFEPEGEAQILKGSTRKGKAASSQQAAKPLQNRTLDPALPRSGSDLYAKPEHSVASAQLVWYAFPFLLWRLFKQGEAKETNG
jgi:hypothetical protein